MSDYCGECEQRPEGVFRNMGQTYCPTGKLQCAFNHPACRKFSEKTEKKRTCGECYFSHWNRTHLGLCLAYPVAQKNNTWQSVVRDGMACDNFEGEASRDACGGTAERGM